MLLTAATAMREQNPMLGLRGCRLGLMIPDFVKIQTRAILNAQIAVKKAGGNPIAKIMIPLVGHVNELAETRRELRDARTTPTRSDPFIDLLTSQVADLRATVATQQALLADMTGRVLDLLTRIERQAELTAAAHERGIATDTLRRAGKALRQPHGGSVSAAPALTGGRRAGTEGRTWRSPRRPAQPG